MSSKKWAISLIALTLSVILAFGAMTFYFDPLLQYTKEPGNLTYRHYSELYCNPGIAKNYDYNSVFLGSSMVENTDVSEIDDLFGCKTIKVPYSGGSSYNHKTILDICYNSHNTIDKVFWALDEYALTTNKDTPRYPLPDYLYDDNKLNDLSYLLNLDIAYFYTTKSLFGTLQNKNQIMMRDGSWSTDDSVYCKKNALASISYPMEQQNNKGELVYSKNLSENLTYNILPFIQNHPETEFHFFMVPYSISYWYMNKQKGTLDAEIYLARTAIGEILEHPNAKVHFFQDNYEIITNLDNYKDHTHFKPEINSYMSNQMAQGTNLLTKENYNERLDEFHKFLSEFDYDEFYKENMN